VKVTMPDALLSFVGLKTQTAFCGPPPPAGCWAVADQIVKLVTINVTRTLVLTTVMRRLPEKEKVQW
jgi:hypothetical protein